MNNKIRKNIWLSLAILSVGASVDRAIRVVDGALEWWQLVSAIIIYAFFPRFNLCHCRVVRKGNWHGHVKFMKR